MAHRPLLLLAIAAAALLALASPARADAVFLRDGSRLIGDAVVVGSHVHVIGFTGRTVVPLDQVLTIRFGDESGAIDGATGRGEAPPADADPAAVGDGPDPHGLFAEALEAEREGDSERAEALRRLAGELEIRRRAHELDPDGDEEIWRRLEDMAAALALDPGLVEALRARRALEGPDRTGRDPGRAEALAQGMVEPTIPPPARRGEEARAADGARDAEALAADDGVQTWRRHRSYRGPRAPVVIVYPERAAERRPPPPQDRVIVIGAQRLHDPPPPRRRAAARPGGETTRMIDFGARRTFQAAGRQGSTFDAARFGSTRTFDAAHGGRTLSDTLRARR